MPKRQGKFESDLDAMLYEIALDGSDTKAYEDGSSVTLVSEIVPPDRPFTDWTPQRLATLDDAEKAEARTIRAAILFERSDGIVEVQKFTDNASAEQNFHKYPDSEIG